MNNEARLCIVPCGSSKIWDINPVAGPQRAEEVYTGVFAKACQRYAKAFFKNWVILSAKHGFLFPNDVICESYNVSFIKPSSETIGLEALKEQAAMKGLYRYQEITVLGGIHYIDRAKELFSGEHTIDLPLNDCKGIGFMLQRISGALELGEEIDAVVDTRENRPVHRSNKTRTTNTTRTATQIIGKYGLLYNHLRGHGGDTVKLTTEEIEALLGFCLPPSAAKHRAWWSNDFTHTQAKSWLLADWEVANISLPYITFRKSSD
jgi:hypothetical protein